MSAPPEKASVASMPMRALILLALLAAVLAPPATAADARFGGRDEPLASARSLQGLERTLPARRAPFRFNLVGLHWQGGGDVWFRTRGDGGGWGIWSPAIPEGEDRPDPGSPEARRRAGWRLGNPWWTGSARWIQYRLEGDVARLRAFFVWSPPAPTRGLSLVGTPSVVPRAGWGADESIVRGTPSYAGRLRLAVVHHTAGRNDYGPGESAAIVKAIELYHVKANGWNDIGYNFLVDRYGQVFEGRAGGVERNVVGAHARGFNAGSVGVAILGNYQGDPVSAAAESALTDLLAWRLDVGHVDPLSSPEVTSGGNERFAPGARITLRAVSGHRDTGDTACPGDELYGLLPAVAQAAAARGLPKLYEPLATPAGLRAGPDGTYEPVAVTARLSDALPWTVTVVDEASGAVLASGSGTGPAVSWVWDGTGGDGRPADPAGRYAVTISSTADVRPATLTLGGAEPPVPALGVSALEVDPAAVTPNGDGAGDAARISFHLSAPARVRIRLEDAAGAKVATIMPERSLGAGTAEATWAAATQTGIPVPDGAYTVVVIARANGRTVRSSAPLVVDRTLAALRAAPLRFSPNGDGRRDVLSIEFALAAAANVRVSVERGGRVVATISDGPLEAGGQHLSWDGTLVSGRAADGAYAVAVEAATALGTRRLVARVDVDTVPPSLGTVSASSRRGTARIRFTLSEAARVKVWAGAKAVAIDRAAGARTFSVSTSARRLRLRAWDSAGNASRIVRVTARR